MKFSDAELSRIENALRVAAEQYDRDAEIVKATGNQRLVFTFQEQARQARELILKIENA